MMMDDTPAYPEALYDSVVGPVRYEEAGLTLSGWLASWLQAIISPHCSAEGRWEGTMGRGLKYDKTVRRAPTFLSS